MSRVRLVLSVGAMLLILAATGQFSAWSFPMQAGQPGIEENDIVERGKAFADAWARAEQLHPSSGSAQGAGQAPEEKVHRVGDGITAPKIISKAEPEYTEEARDAKVEGTVVLSVEIRPDGRARNILVKKGLDRGLDKKAVEAVEKWTFEPSQKDGQPVTVGATIEINFRLN